MFCEFYLDDLFKFKIGPWLSLFCLMLYMFIIMRIIIRIIKITRSENTVLLAQLKVGGLFLLITLRLLFTFTRFLARTFRKIFSTSTQNNFCHSSYFFWIITHILMDKYFALFTLRHTFIYNSGRLDDTGYRIFLIVEYLQPYKLQIKSNFNPVY